MCVALCGGGHGIVVPLVTFKFLPSSAFSLDLPLQVITDSFKLHAYAAAADPVSASKSVSNVRYCINSAELAASPPHIGAAGARVGLQFDHDDYKSQALK